MAPSVVAVNRQTGLTIGSSFTLNEALATGAPRASRLFITLAVDIGMDGQISSAAQVGWELSAPWELVEHSYMGTSSASSRTHAVQTWTALLRDDPLPATGTLVNVDTSTPLVANATQSTADNGYTAPPDHDCICVAVAPGYGSGQERATLRHRFTSGTVTSVAPTRWGTSPPGGTTTPPSVSPPGLFLQVDRLDPRNLGGTYPNTGRNAFTGVDTANGFTIVSSTWDEWRVSTRSFTTPTATPPLIHAVAQDNAQSTWAMWVVGTMLALNVPDPRISGPLLGLGRGLRSLHT